jgi:hypothetical protein
MYRTPAEHNNPLDAALASWDGDRLTLFDSG